MLSTSESSIHLITSISHTGHHSVRDKFSASQLSPALLYLARTHKLISSNMKMTMAVSRSTLKQSDVQNVCISPGISKEVKHCGGEKQLLIYQNVNRLWLKGIPEDGGEAHVKTGQVIFTCWAQWKTKKGGTINMCWLQSVISCPFSLPHLYSPIAATLSVLSSPSCFVG